MQRLRDLFQSSQPESDNGIYIECRHCGTSVNILPDECPICDRTEFVTYTLEGDETGHDCDS